MESLRGELTALYRKQFIKLDAAECAGKDTTKMRIQLLEAYVKDLNEQNEMLVQMVEDAAHIKDDLCERDKQMTNQLNRTRDSLCQVQEDLDFERESNATLSCKISALKTENCSFCRRLEDAQKEINILNKTICEQECMVKKTHKKLCDLEEQVNLASDEIDQLEDKLQCAHVEIDRLKKCLKNDEVTIQEMTEDLCKTKDCIDSLDKENNILQGDIEDLKKELELKTHEQLKLESKISDLNREIINQNEKLLNSQEHSNDLARKNGSLTEKLQTSNEKLDQLDNVHVNLMEDFDSYQERHSYSNDDYKQLENQYFVCKEKLRECQCILEEKIQHMNDLNNELICVKEELGHANDKLKQFSHEVEDLGQKNQQSIADLRALDQDNDILKKSLLNVDQKLQSSEQELNAKENELSRRKDEIRSLKNELRNSNTELAHLNNNLQTSEHDIYQLRLDKEKLTSDLSEACSMYNSLAKENESMKENKRDEESELEDVKRTECLEKELSDMQCKCVQLENEVRDITHKLETTCNDKSYALQQVNKLELDLTAACCQIRDLDKQLCEYKQRLCNSENELYKDEDAIHKMENCIHTLEAKLRKSQEQACCLEMRLEEMQKCADGEESKLQQEIRRLKCDLEHETCCRRELEYQIASKDQLINSLRFKNGS